MKGNISIDLSISRKSLLLLVSVFSAAAMAKYVTIVSAESSGGITVTKEVYVDTTPVGTIAMLGASAIPSGWIELDGGSTAGYPDLASLYGSTVPDFRGQHVRAWDNGKGVDSGRGLLSVQADNIKSHGHDLKYGNYSATLAAQLVNNYGNNAVFSHYRYGRGNTYSRPNESDTMKAIGQHNGVTMATENRIKNVSVVFIVKAELKKS